MSDRAKAFGLAVKGHREAAELSKIQLAYRAGVSEDFIHRIEAGARLPGLRYAYALADGLNISLPFLLIDVEVALWDAKEAA